MRYFFLIAIITIATPIRKITMAIIFYYTYFYCHLSGRRGSLVIGCSKTETGQHNYPDELDHVICTPWKRALTITLVTRLVSRPDPRSRIWGALSNPAPRNGRDAPFQGRKGTLITSTSQHFTVSSRLNKRECGISMTCLRFTI